MLDIKQVVHQAAALRNQRQFQKAIDLVETHYPNLDPDLRIVALMQGFYAAVGAGFTEKARAFAKQIAQEEPELPSIQSYL
jgi:hypothetical protein